MCYQDIWGESATLVIAGVVLSAAEVALLIVAVIGLLYLLCPPFKKAIDDLIASLYLLISEFIGYLTNVISEAVAKAKRSRQYRGTEVHHIVAQTDRRAKYSRQVINSYLIFVWHPVNLVTISKTLHKHLHTNAYFAAVDLCMASIKFTAGGFTDTRLRIMAMLLTIAAILKVASQAI